MSDQEAGPSLDAEVARVVFRRTGLHGAGGIWLLGDPGEYCPPYSTRIEAAWLVVERANDYQFWSGAIIVTPRLWWGVAGGSMSRNYGSRRQGRQHGIG